MINYITNLIILISIYKNIIDSENKEYKNYKNFIMS